MDDYIYDEEEIEFKCSCGCENKFLLFYRPRVEFIFPPALIGHGFLPTDEDLNTIINLLIKSRYNKSPQKTEPTTVSDDTDNVDELLGEAGEILMSEPCSICNKPIALKQEIARYHGKLNHTDCLIDKLKEEGTLKW